MSKSVEVQVQASALMVRDLQSEDDGGREVFTRSKTQFVAFRSKATNESSKVITTAATGGQVVDRRVPKHSPQ